MVVINPWGNEMDAVKKEIYKEHFADYLLCLALDVGEALLKNGAEISRVEDTIERICRAYGAKHIEVFCIISCINVAIRMPDGTYSSQMRRVKAISNNLYALEELNALSRKVCREKPELEEFDRKIHEIRKTKVYPTYISFVAYGAAAGSFALFFGGNFKDVLVAFVLGLVIALVDKYAPSRLTEIAKTAISSFLACSLAMLAVKVGIGNNESAIITGFIMLLVPGVLFGTAMRDIFCGDLLAGSLKTLQALLLSFTIALGYMAAALIF
jgi:uncharacterized membrane protein YjjP (DUF1212 family)